MTGPTSAGGLQGVVASEDWWPQDLVRREGWGWGQATARIWAEWLVNKVASPEIINRTVQ